MQNHWESKSWKIPKSIKNVLDKKDSDEIFSKAGKDQNLLFFEKMYQYHSQLKSDEEKRKVCLWIISKWGGIRNIKDDIFSTANENYNNLIKQQGVEFNRIASWSKYLTIKDPEKFAIYDTRIAYTLNVLKIIFDLDYKYYPMPTRGRNTILNAFMMDTVINFLEAIRKGRTAEEQVKCKDDRFREATCYIEYISLLKIMHDLLFANENNIRLFRVESILFAISVDIIPDVLLEKFREINIDQNNFIKEYFQLKARGS